MYVEPVSLTCLFVCICSRKTADTFVLYNNRVVNIGQCICLASAVDDSSYCLIDRDLSDKLCPERICNIFKLLVLNVCRIKSESIPSAVV